MTRNVLGLDFYNDDEDDFFCRCCSSACWLESMFSCVSYWCSLMCCYCKDSFEASEWQAARFSFYKESHLKRTLERVKQTGSTSGVVSKRESEGILSFMSLSCKRLAVKSIHPHWGVAIFISFYTNWIFAPRSILFIAITIFLNSHRRSRCVRMCCRQKKMLKLFNECMRTNA